MSAYHLEQKIQPATSYEVTNNSYPTTFTNRRDKLSPRAVYLIDEMSAYHLEQKIQPATSYEVTNNLPRLRETWPPSYESKTCYLK